MHHHLPGLAADPKSLPVEALAKTYQQLGVFFNEVNRAMGLKDLVPEVISDEVVKKLAFIHDAHPPQTGAGSRGRRTAQPSNAIDAMAYLSRGPRR